MEEGPQVTDEAGKQHEASLHLINSFMFDIEDIGFFDESLVPKCLGIPREARGHYIRMLESPRRSEEHLLGMLRDSEHITNPEEALAFSNGLSKIQAYLFTYPRYRDADELGEKLGKVEQQYKKFGLELSEETKKNMILGSLQSHMLGENAGVTQEDIRGIASIFGTDITEEELRLAVSSALAFTITSDYTNRGFQSYSRIGEFHKFYLDEFKIPESTRTDISREVVAYHLSGESNKNHPLGNLHEAAGTIKDYKSGDLFDKNVLLEEEIKRLGADRVATLLSSPLTFLYHQGVNLKKALGLENTPEIKLAAVAAVIKEARDHMDKDVFDRREISLSQVRKMVEEFGLIQDDLTETELETLNEAVSDVLLEKIKDYQESPYEETLAKELKNILQLSKPLGLSIGQQIESISTLFELTPDEFVEFVLANRQFVEYVLRKRGFKLKKEDLKYIEGLPEATQNLTALEILKESEYPIEEGVSTEEQCVAFFKQLKAKHPDWQDGHSIALPFEKGAGVFGYQRMFRYIQREGLSLHDALHAFGKIVVIHEATGLEADEFYNNILHQVSMDDSEYSEGTAHHHLNAIAQTSNPDVGQVIDKVQEYKEIERLQELAKTFNSPQAVFSSWQNLKRYSELEQILGQSIIFDELKELKAEGANALYHYIETLAFHPDSKVDMRAVIKFWRDPELFLAARASHTPDEVQDRKKPSNYIDMPNLDLTAIELRDALVEGKMDQIQAFTPLEVRYTIPVEDYAPQPLVESVSKALGSKRKGIKGAAKNPRKLFSEINALLKPHGTDVIKYLGGEDLPEAVDPVQLESLVYDQNFGMRRPKVKAREFVARISNKSDPEGAIAGDDTVNCMPFGDGKNTVYTFNPNTAQFVIRIVKADGKERTIAQSVLTKDMDVKIPVPDLISSLEDERGHLEDILPQEVLREAPAYITGDNIEVSPNFSDDKYQQIIGAIMRDYFKEYMTRYAESQGVELTKVPIGRGYSDALLDLPTAPNTFVPQAPVSYSDKIGEKVSILDLTKNEGAELILKRSVTAPERPQNTQPELPNIPGIEYLTFEDALRVGYIEGKAYEDNESLMQFLFNMENSLIAKDINNTTKDRPNMSLKYTDDEGQMRGYLLAWEGRLTDEDVEYDAQEFYNQPCLYVPDIATDRESVTAGGRLIKAFTQLYKRNYLDRGELMPIYAQTRETTSYKIIQKQLGRLGNSIGIDFELIELPTYKVGKDTMHPIVIRPISTKK